jgi:hypothetical protein
VRPAETSHLLDLRAWVRLRHALVNQRGEWQQRIHSELYHHGLPQHRELLTRANRAWVEPRALPATYLLPTAASSSPDRWPGAWSSTPSDPIVTTWPAHLVCLIGVVIIMYGPR